MSRDGTPSKVSVANEPSKTSGFFNSMLNVAQTLGSSVLNNSTSRSPLSLLSSRTNEGATDQPQPLEAAIVRDESGAALVLSLKDMGIDGAGLDSAKEGVGTILGGDQQEVTGTSAVESRSVVANAMQGRSGSVADESFRSRRRSSTGHSLSGLLGSYGEAPKITGFAVASNKRNREFHALFRSVPDNDYLLDDYGCALQREILIQGRMYVSEAHLCFNSNIFGWVTNLVVAFADVVSIEKRSTAGIFPNAIQIATPHAKHIFASFISRDSVFDLLVNIWKLGHPSVQTTAHGVEAVPTAAYESSESGSDHETLSGSEGEEQSSDEADANDRASIDSFAVADDRSLADPAQAATKDTEPSMTANVAPANASTVVTEHAPTEAPALADGSSLKTEILDEQVDLPLETMFSLVFGDDDSFMRDFLEQNQKLIDVSIESIRPSAGQQKSRKVAYVKPLSGPIGPKQTKCLVEQALERYERNTFMQILETTTTPDVPSGDAFSVKTRYCFMWGQKNRTRLAIHCDVIWTKTSWIKSVIDKSAVQGQIEYGMALVEALRSKALAANGGGTSRTKRRRPTTGKRDRELATSAGQARQGTGAGSTQAQISAEGMFGFVSHINTSLLLFVMLVGVLISMWRMQQTIRTLSSDRGGAPFGSGSARWRDEEYAMWSWLSSRTEPDRSIGVTSSGRVEDRMLQLQLSELIKQADERLALLREAQRLQSQRVAARTKPTKEVSDL